MFSSKENILKKEVKIFLNGKNVLLFIDLLDRRSRIP